MPQAICSFIQCKDFFPLLFVETFPAGFGTAFLSDNPQSQIRLWEGSSPQHVVLQNLLALDEAVPRLS